MILETNECPEFRKSLRKPTVIGPIFIYVLGRQISPQMFSQGFQNFLEYLFMEHLISADWITNSIWWNAELIW